MLIKCILTKNCQGQGSVRRGEHDNKRTLNACLTARSDEPGDLRLGHTLGAGLYSQYRKLGLERMNVTWIVA